MPSFPSKPPSQPQHPFLTDKALLSFWMSLYSEELQQELAWVGVTHRAQSVTQEALAKSRIYDLPLLSCLFLINRNHGTPGFWCSCGICGGNETTVKGNVKSTDSSVTQEICFTSLSFWTCTVTTTPCSSNSGGNYSLCCLAFLFPFKIRFLCLLCSSLSITWSRTIDIWIRCIMEWACKVRNVIESLPSAAGKINLWFPAVVF